MQTVNIHEARTHLSRLVEQAAKGEPFLIAKAGKPLVKVMALEAPVGEQVRRLSQVSWSVAGNRFRIRDELPLHPRLRGERVGVRWVAPPESR